MNWEKPTPPLSKAEATPSGEAFKPLAKRSDKKQRRERWPKDLTVEQEVIEPAEVRANPAAFRCIGEEITEMLDYQPAKFSAARSFAASSSGTENPSWLRSLLSCRKVCSNAVLQ